MPCCRQRWRLGSDLQQRTLVRKGQSSAAHLPWLQLSGDVCTCCLGKGSLEKLLMSSSVPWAPSACTVGRDCCCSCYRYIRLLGRVGCSLLSEEGSLKDHVRIVPADSLTIAWLPDKNWMLKIPCFGDGQGLKVVPSFLKKTHSAAVVAFGYVPVNYSTLYLLWLL